MSGCCRARSFCSLTGWGASCDLPSKTLSPEIRTVLKEYVIGTEVYDRKPPYHPSQDSIVRTEARRLRAKLKEYYESEGKT